MTEAAVEQAKERSTAHLKVSRIVLAKGSRDRVTEVVKLGDDYVVEVTEPNGRILWTTVVEGEKSSRYHETQEEAILHLIARRYDANPNTNAQAAFYAGRVLGTNRIKTGR